MKNPRSIDQQIADVAEAFTRQSVAYDEYEVDNENLKRVREEIHGHFLGLIKPGDKILEVNAGTGTDAVHFAQQRFRVHATDVAEGMVREIQKKARQKDLEGLITTQVASFTYLTPVTGGPYRACFSNIGGLNCIPDLKAFAQQLPLVLDPGGIVTIVVMPRLCPWEWLEIFRGRFSVATRRWSKGGAVVSPKGVPYRIYYHTASHVVSSFRPRFRLINQQSLSLFAPPMDRKQFSGRYPRVYKFLVTLDNLVTKAYPFNQLGDFLVYSFRYEP